MLLRRKAKKLRDERGMQDGGRYVARSEVNKQELGEAMKRSLSRPLSMFLVFLDCMTVLIRLSVPRS